VIEIEALDELQREVFGPALHVLRYRGDVLPGLLRQINATGYGLTLGLHTRIDETVSEVERAAKVGNLYVNRSMVGAVVGVQPFGGQGLSGTGPKSGGPLYLYRLLSQAPPDVLSRAQRVASAPLPGPTGERNLYRLVPREAVLCLAADDADRQRQLDAVLAVGSRALWPALAQTRAHWQRLPRDVQARVSLVDDWAAHGTLFDAVLLHGTPEELITLQQVLAGREGPVVSVERLAPGDPAVPLERLVLERSVSINTAAAGGNPGLMAMA
jgi:RHH-type proline utilization regulon transcriptional repressor/proline dehydrogenase/delta 1-pyrroline-5-carboxylate dehydrogenase